MSVRLLTTLGLAGPMGAVWAWAPATDLHAHAARAEERQGPLSDPAR